jgi:bifunctional enzyme CysN/CysC
MAEREQGITIDVAYRFFATPARKFIVADAPGHEQYTRNMVTGASTADAALVLVDARKGVLTQTRRHSYVLALLGVRHVALAVNKMDLVDFSADIFRAIEEEYLSFAAEIGLPDVVCLPVSARGGDNVAAPSPRLAWHAGPTVLGYLEGVEPDDGRSAERAPFRLPVQWVNRPHPEFRACAGLVMSGRVRPGDRVRVMPSGRATRVARIVTFDGDLPQAVAGQSIQLTLADEIDVGRGDVIASADRPSAVADQCEATIVWMSEEPMLPGRAYWLKIGARTVTAILGHPRYRVDVNTLERVAARRLELNEIGLCDVALDAPIAFDPYREQRATGGFILIDRVSQHTVGAGLLTAVIRRADHVHWQALDVDKRTRAAQKGQRPCVVWFTGLSGAGKSTIANLAEKQLCALGRHTYLLDGDNVRHGLNRDLGFTAEDRVENIRRVAEVARLMVDAGLIVLVAFISPFRSERRMARALFEPGEFVEVWVDTPLAVAEARDPKGLYRRVRRGELRDFTGIDSPYEAPERAELRIDTTTTPAEDAADVIVTYLRDH